MRPAIIKTRTERGLYYVVYPKLSGKKPKCTDQLRIAKMYRNLFNYENQQNINYEDLESIQSTNLKE